MIIGRNKLLIINKALVLMVSDYVFGSNIILKSMSDEDTFPNPEIPSGE